MNVKKIIKYFFYLTTQWHEGRATKVETNYFLRLAYNLYCCVCVDRPCLCFFLLRSDISEISNTILDIGLKEHVSGRQVLVDTIVYDLLIINIPSHTSAVGTVHRPIALLQIHPWLVWLVSSSL